MLVCSFTSYSKTSNGQNALACDPVSAFGDVKLPQQQFKTLLNGVIQQDKDNTVENPDQMTSVTNVKPTSEQLEDLYFANKIVKHTKSNTMFWQKTAQLPSIRCGQNSRVDALKQAIEKAKSFGFDLNGSSMASDAFFPFPDCVELAAEAGIAAVLQPGGSIKDQLSIDMANEKGLAM
ncbi:hypothetical protein FQR65_LT17346 [Abscondita terminalis]|nr:hypothetical protein FQR65_LT17346 [Abscondita terminalis]